MLDPDVRHSLYAMCGDVLAIIAVKSDALALAVIECAQDRVFDEVLETLATPYATPQRPKLGRHAAPETILQANQ
jgi:hypothetical protein